MPPVTPSRMRRALEWTWDIGGDVGKEEGDVICTSEL